MQQYQSERDKIDSSAAACKQTRNVVRSNQKSLAKLGFYSSTIDGLVGPNYFAAVRRAEDFLKSRADSDPNCLRKNERLALEAIALARKNGSTCGDLYTQQEIDELFTSLVELGLTSRANSNSQTTSGLIWAIGISSRLEKQLQSNYYYLTGLQSKRDCRLDERELAFFAKPSSDKDDQTITSNSSDIAASPAQPQQTAVNTDVEAEKSSTILESELKELEKDLEKREKLLALRETVLKREIEKKEADLKEKDQRLRAAEAALSKKSLEEASTTTTAQLELAELSKQLEAEEKKLLDLQLQLTERENELEQKSSEISDRKIELSRLEERLVSILERQEAELAEFEMSLDARESSLNERADKLTLRELQVDGARAELTELRELLEKRENDLKEKSESSAERQKTLDSLEVELTKRQSEIDVLQRKQDEKQKLLSQKTNELNDLSQKFTSLKKSLSEFIGDLDNFEDEANVVIAGAQNTVDGGKSTNQTGYDEVPTNAPTSKKNDNIIAQECTTKNVASCTDDVLCEKATMATDTPNVRKWFGVGKYIVFGDEARRRNLTCQVPVEETKKNPFSSLDDETRENPFSSLDDKTLCKRATRRAEDGVYRWHEQRSDLKAEAQRRRLSCGLTSNLNRNTFALLEIPDDVGISKMANTQNCWDLHYAAMKSKEGISGAWKFVGNKGYAGMMIYHQWCQSERSCGLNTKNATVLKVERTHRPNEAETFYRFNYGKCTQFTKYIDKGRYIEARTVYEGTGCQEWSGRVNKKKLASCIPSRNWW